MDRCIGGRNFCIGVCNYGKLFDFVDNVYNVFCLFMVSYNKFIYILLFSFVMYFLICYFSNF